MFKTKLVRKLFYLSRLVILQRQHTWSMTKGTRSGSNMNTPQAYSQLKRPDFTNPNCTRLIFWRRKMMKTMRGPCKIWKRPKKAKKKSKENNESNSWNDVTTSFEYGQTLLNQSNEDHYNHYSTLYFCDKSINIIINYARPIVEWDNKYLNMYLLPIPKLSSYHIHRWCFRGILTFEKVRGQIKKNAKRK